MSPKYEVEFLDGKKVVKDAPGPNEAKESARAERRGTVPTDTPRSAPEVKIKSVVQVEDKAPAESPARASHK